MHSSWNLWVTTKNKEKAQRLYSKVIEQMGRAAQLCSIEPYPKIDGFVVSFKIELDSQQWNDAVVETISLGQRFAYAWHLTGEIEGSPEATSHQTNIPGVVMAAWWLFAEDIRQSLVATS